MKRTNCTMDKMKIKELRMLVRKHGIEAIYLKRRYELIEAIQEKEKKNSEDDHKAAVEEYSKQKRAVTYKLVGKPWHRRLVPVDD